MVRAALPSPADLEAIAYQLRNGLWPGCGVARWHNFRCFRISAGAARGAGRLVINERGCGSYVTGQNCKGTPAGCSAGTPRFATTRKLTAALPNSAAKQTRRKKIMAGFIERDHGNRFLMSSVNVIKCARRGWKLSARSAIRKRQHLRS